MTPRGAWAIPLLAGIAAACGLDAGEPDARFAVAGTGALRDARTGLVWTDRDLGGELDWHAAEALCRELSRAGHDDWRLPEISELEVLHDADEAQPCGRFTCAVDPALALQSPYVWSATPGPPQRRFYADLRFGSKLAPRLRPDLTRRVLCVRGNAPAAPSEP